MAKMSWFPYRKQNSIAETRSTMESFWGADGIFQGASRRVDIFAKEGAAVKEIAENIGKEHIGAVVGNGILEKSVCGVCAQGSVKLRPREFIGHVLPITGHGIGYGCRLELGQPFG